MTVSDVRVCIRVVRAYRREKSAGSYRVELTEVPAEIDWLKIEVRDAALRGARRPLKGWERKTARIAAKGGFECRPHRSHLQWRTARQPEIRSLLLTFSLIYPRRRVPG
jgi:hypothetical protein